MLNKKLVCVFVMFACVLFVSACTNDSGDTSQQPLASSDPTSATTVYIPTDSGLADSIFENDNRTPTKVDNGTTEETKAEQFTDSTKPTEKDDPADNTGSDGKTDPTTEVTAPNTPPAEMTYEAFVALTPEQQRLYQESFNDLDAFFEWYVAAKEKYEKENPPIDIDGPVDLGKY